MFNQTILSFPIPNANASPSSSHLCSSTYSPNDGQELKSFLVFQNTHGNVSILQSQLNQSVFDTEQIAWADRSNDIYSCSPDLTFGASLGCMTTGVTGSIYDPVFTINFLDPNAAASHASITVTYNEINDTFDCCTFSLTFITN